MRPRTPFGAAGFGTETQTAGAAQPIRGATLLEIDVDGHRFDADLRCRRCGASAWAWVEAGVPCRR